MALHRLQSVATNNFAQCCQLGRWLSTSALRRAAPLGAFVDHVDLTQQPLDPAAARAVRSALLRHRVIVLRHQRFDLAKAPAADSLVASARVLFGPDLQPMSQDGTKFVQLYIADGGRQRRQNSDWFHSDLSYLSRPSSVTMLWAIEVPPGPAGDTVFVDAIAAYKALPVALQRRLEGQLARHDVRTTQGQTSELNTVHPVIRPHPISGDLAVYANPGYTSNIVGDADKDGALLAELFEHCSQERFQMSHRYQPGDLIIWDNAAVWHRATTLDLAAGSRRVMMRVSVLAGEAGSGERWWPAADELETHIWASSFPNHK